MVPCTLCNGAKKLPLGRKDYLECPGCDGKGEVPCVKATITPGVVFAVDYFSTNNYPLSRFK